MTPTKQEMLEKIYNNIADKTLSFGCKVLHKPDIGVCYDVKYMYTGGKYDNRPYNVDEIIGHPVMIGDILDWIEKTMGKQIHWRDDGSPYKAFIANEKLAKLFDLRKDKRNPIEDQSDEAVDFIYSLINQG